MELKNQVCTLEQAKRLSELGISEGSNFYYYQCMYREEEKGKIDCGSWEFCAKPSYHKNSESHYPAFTVAELGVMLPAGMQKRGRKDEFVWFYNGFDTDERYFNSGLNSTKSRYWTKKIINATKTEAQARAEMLIHLLENKLITPEQVNASLTQQQ